jgi:hypothetical protein
MSTKTLRKRIALVAVSALGAGLLSVVAVPSANAAVVNGSENSAVGTAGPASAENVLNIASINSLTGSAEVSATVGSNRSIGLVNISDIAGTRISGTTQTAVLLSNGALTVYTTTNGTNTNDANFAAITVEGGTIGTAVAADGLNSSRTVGVWIDANTVAAASIVPNAGATTMTVRMYTGTEANYSSTSEAVALATAVAAPSIGTLDGQITVTIAAASTAGAIAASKSGLYYVSSYSASNSATSDTAGLGAAAATSKQYGAITIRDAYGTGVATGGLLQVSATNGARVALADSVGTASTAFSTSLGNGQGFTVANPTNAPLSTTVTVTYNGTVIGTKSFSFWGEVAKVELSGAEIGKQGTTANNEVKVNLYDAAGNAIYFSYATVASTFTPAAGLITSANSDDSVVADVAPAIAADGTITPGQMDFACASTATKQNIQVQYVNNSGSVITSNLLPVLCAGDAVSFKLSYDKATYAPGEIAVATVSFFDKAGNASHDNSGAEPTAAAVVLSNSGFKGTTSLVAPANGDNTTLGKVTYSFVVDVTEGTFTNSVAASTVDTAATANGVKATKAATSTFTVKSNSTAVSNADVLKAIVSLIASINKQIAALQKALLKR